MDQCVKKRKVQFIDGVISKKFKIRYPDLISRVIKENWIFSGIADGRKCSFMIFEIKVKADSKRVNASFNSSPSPTSDNVSWVEPSTILSITSADGPVNRIKTPFIQQMLCDPWAL